MPKIESKLSSEDESRFQALLENGEFEIFPQPDGPDVFVVHRLGRKNGEIILHERISINPQTGFGNSDNPLIAAGPLLLWIRQKTRWTPDIHEQWIKNERAVDLSNVPIPTQ